MAGSHHTLTFEVGNVVDQTGPFGTSSTVKVKVNGAAVFSATNSRGAGLTHIVWQKFSVQITAPSTTTKILFLNGDPPSDTANGLDCVNLT